MNHVPARVGLQLQLAEHPVSSYCSTFPPRDCNKPPATISSRLGILPPNISLCFSCSDHIGGVSGIWNDNIEPDLK